MKKLLLVPLCISLFLFGCTSQDEHPEEVPSGDVTRILLHDDGIRVNDTPVTEDPAQAIYIANDIVYYPTGMDHTFGEGTDADEHDPEEALKHTVIHITKPGTYSLSGALSRGQIAVDLGEGAKNDPSAVVTLILDNAEITCTVAPALIFYRVYECGSKDNPAADVDTSTAGANLILADESINVLRGSYVAKIYKPDSVELSEDGTEVTDSKKLHKYDGAVYSKMSMNIDGNGQLTVEAENEGIGSEMHLSVNGGNIRISSGNDGINTNEDGVSVTAVNGGNLNIRVNGATGEGDGIDSNGWIVINGGQVTAQACSFSQDSGIDSDMGILIRGGSIVATGNMLDTVDPAGGICALFRFAQRQIGGQTYRLESEETVFEFTPENDFSCLLVAGDTLSSGEYTFYCGDEPLAGMDGEAPQPGGSPGGMGPGMPFDDKSAPPEPPAGHNPGTGSVPGEDVAMPPEGFPRDENGSSPGNSTENGSAPPRNSRPGSPVGDLSTRFDLRSGISSFANVQIYME